MKYCNPIGGASASENIARASPAHPSRPPPRIIAKEPIPPAFKPRAPKPYRMDLDAVLSQDEI